MQLASAWRREAPHLAASALNPATLLPEPGSGRTPPQEEVPDSGRMSLAPGDQATLRPPQQNCRSPPGEGAAWGGGCGPCGPAESGREASLGCRGAARGGVAAGGGDGGWCRH